MKRAYIDSSILVAIALGQSGAAALERRLLRFEHLHAAGLLEAEIAAALSRERVDPALADPHLQNVSFVDPPRRLTSEIRRVLDAGRLRGADLWHLACALFLSPDPRELVFLTLDLDQRRVARKLGFHA